MLFWRYIFFLTDLAFLGLSSHTPQRNLEQTRKQTKPTSSYLRAIETLLKTENQIQVGKITLLYNLETY